MNIKVQCCGIVLIALLILISKRRRHLNLITGKVFQGCFYVTLGCLILDVASIFGIVYRDVLPAFLPEFICKTYVASLVLVAMLAVVYVATGVSFHLPYYKKIITACTAFGGLVIALIYALPIIIHEEAEKNLAWTSGPSAYVTYFGVFAFIVINLVQIFSHKEYIYERQRRTVLTWMYMWIAAALIQLLNNQLLVVGFASALSVMLVYIQFENPELYLDRTTGLFNYIAYIRYGEELYSGKRAFRVIAVVLEDTTWKAMASSRRNVETQKVYDSFLTIPGADVFKIQESEVLLFFNSEERAKAAWNTMIEQMNTGDMEALLGHPAFYYIDDPRCVSSPRELLELLRHVNLQRNGSKEGAFHIIEGSAAAQILMRHATAQMVLDALNEDRIMVYYQPIYSVEKKRFTSAEALVRIVDREGKLIPPGAFIQVAENNGMIIDIGKRVFEKVCHFFQQSGLEAYGIEYIEVNLSVVQCADEKLADDYIGIMQSARIDPHRINLEITESTSLQGRKTLIANMERMIAHGVSFSLDDFGTGASNLNYIVDMPVQIVKFDRGMIQAYFASGKAKYVMDAAMHMIHGMGLEIVAEGVETQEQYRKLEEIKINYIQGYYFSRPLPEQEFLAFLRRENAGA